MEQLRYLDFELKIERKDGQYTARILKSPAGEATNVFTLPFSDDRLELLVLKIGGHRSNIRSTHSVEMTAARELGGNYSKPFSQVMFVLASRAAWIS